MSRVPPSKSDSVLEPGTGSAAAAASSAKPSRLLDLFPCFPSLYKNAPGWLENPAATALATGVPEVRVRMAADAVLAQRKSIARFSYCKSLYEEPGRSLRMTMREHQAVWREAGLIVRDDMVCNIPPHALLTLGEMADAATENMKLDPAWTAPAGFEGRMRDCNGPNCSRKCDSECVCGWAFCSRRCHIASWPEHEQFCFTVQKSAYLATQLTEAYWSGRPRQETQWSDSDDD